MSGKTQTIEIIRGSGDAFGFTIGGGRDCPVIPSSNGIFITAINKHGSAAKDGRLQVGDELVEVNGIKLSNKTHAEATEIFTTAGAAITLKIFSSAKNRSLVEQKESPRTQKKSCWTCKILGTTLVLAAIGAGVAISYRKYKK